MNDLSKYITKKNYLRVLGEDNTVCFVLKRNFLHQSQSRSIKYRGILNIKVKQQNNIMFQKIL